MIRDFVRNPVDLAEAEVAWWICYHDRDWKGLERAIKNKRRIEYGIEISDESAKNFVEAAQAYILYKFSVEAGDEEDARTYKEQQKQYLTDHYSEIEEKLGLIK